MHKFVLPTLVALIGSTCIAHAQPAKATYQWRAQKTRVAGTQKYCGIDYPSYRIEIKDGVIHGEPEAEGNNPTFNRPFTIKLRALNPDGSGQVVLNNNPKHQNVIYTVESGVGPRVITLRREDVECTFSFLPYR